jgi:hypothetical protein
MLSNYMTGKNIPEMMIVEKCIKRFKLEREGIKDIFSKVFSSTARANHLIHLDTRFFNPQRMDLLAQAIVVFMLYPDDPSLNQKPFDSKLKALRSQISSYFKSLDTEVEYQVPALVESGDSSNPQLTDKSYR